MRTKAMISKIHQTANIESSHIGENLQLSHFSVILAHAKIGNNVTIGSHCLIENDVNIGNQVTIRGGVQIWDRIDIEDNVFIDANVSFATEHSLKNKTGSEHICRTTIQEGVSIGANATISPNITIGKNAIISANTVVIRSVPPNAIVEGNPAKIIGYVDTKNHKTIYHEKSYLQTIGKIETTVTGVTFHTFRSVPDMRGELSVGEFEKEIPFKPLRYFLVFNVPTTETRGEHAHRKCHQFLIAVKGTVHVVADDGKNREEFVLERNNQGLYLPPMTWGIQYHYSSDAVLLVFASEYYDGSDYIRDYSEFMKLISK